MPKELRGICLACSDGEVCVHHHGRIIIQCAQFRPIEISPPGSDPRAHDSPRSTPYLGLCGTCADAGTCVSPKPESGIWHCDRYRTN